MTINLMGDRYEIWYGQNCTENLQGSYATFKAARTAARHLTRAHGSTINRVVMTTGQGELRREVYRLTLRNGTWRNVKTA